VCTVLQFDCIFLSESDNAVLRPMWLELLLALLVSDEHSWIVGSKPLDDLRMWDGFTLNGGLVLLNLKSNTFLSVLEEMQNPDSSTCLTSFATSADSPMSQSPCLRLRNIASFDLRLAAALRSLMSVASVHRNEIVRGAVRCSERFRHAPPTVEVLDMRWHHAAFPRCMLVHKLPQMMQEFASWDLSCSSLPSKSWLSVSECPVVKPVAETNSHKSHADNSAVGTPTSHRAPSPCDLPSSVVIDVSKSKVHRSDAEWQALLSPLQYRVARQQGTEPAFRNLYWDHHEDGVYFSVCSETPLFDSRDKFDSGSGWPSFTRPIDLAFVGETTDTSYGMKRIEVHALADGAHLGHVFEDGPAANGGRRYCINSASLRFVPRKEYNLWVLNRSLQLQAPSFVDARSPGNATIPPPLLPGNLHSIEMPMRYSKWRRPTSSDANCSLTRGGLLCEYSPRSFAVLVQSCSPSAIQSMMSSVPCHLQSNMHSLYTLLLPSFTDCTCSLSDLDSYMNSVPNTSCFALYVTISIPCASTQFACSAKHLLSQRLSGDQPLPQFDYIIGLPGYMMFCPFWLDQLASYVTSSSDGIWWLGVSSVSAFPRLFDDFYILKGGDLSLLEHLQQSRTRATEDSSSLTQEPQSILYSSITVDAAAVANHASAMVRPMPLVERLFDDGGSCDCGILSACIVSEQTPATST
jgi:methionine-R-sulfoxide reductase